jgi:hypothetical protein
MEMEKKFLHERLRKPHADVDGIYRALIETRRESIRAYGIPCTEFPWSFMERNFERFKVHAYYDNFYRAGGVLDPSFKMLSMLGQFLTDESVTPFVFQKDFFKILMKTKIMDFTWNLLPEEFLGVLRFPSPILDQEGDPISDVAVAIMPRDKAEQARGARYSDITDGIGSKVFWCWFEYNNDHLGFFDQLIPDDGQLKITDTWSRRFYDSRSVHTTPTIRTDDIEKERPHLFEILKAIVYINSGDPDLREFRNKIRFQSKDSKTPVKDHKPYSLVDYQVVGYNWMKDREHNVDSWGVEPFLRRQRIGPGRTGWKYVMVKEHTRSLARQKGR